MNSHSNSAMNIVTRIDKSMVLKLQKDVELATFTSLNFKS